ncbi:hypothetical protein R9X47_23185 [Wukongibacter baidiensis]|uniref:hypothetical protein n=1 Tax=Wukongibacter baidiensis TaxID=1723361 RepID=UPI003D7F424A
MWENSSYAFSFFKDAIYSAIMNNKDVEVSGKECLNTQKLINSIYEYGGRNGEVVEIM